MIKRQWFIADITMLKEDGTPYHSQLQRILDSPAGKIGGWYAISLTVLPLLLLYYDWLNDHHAASLYARHVMPLLLMPLDWLRLALNLLLGVVFDGALFITSPLS